MAVLDVVKLDVVSDDFIVQKYLSDSPWELNLGSQLVVNEGQEALFVKGGIALDIFTPGTHTLVSQNIPLIGKLLHSSYGGQTPFTTEIWFVNKTAKRNLRWGTPHRIAVVDPVLGYPINIGACGQWGIRVDDSRSFVRQLVGAQLGADSHRVYTYFIGEIYQKFSQLISETFQGGMSFFKINSTLDELAQKTVSAIRSEFERFGIEIVNFTISNINIAPNEMEKIQSVMGAKMEMRQLSDERIGQGYLTAKSFEVLCGAVKNQNVTGSVLGAFVGTGLGIGTGQSLGHMAAQMTHPSSIAQGSDPLEIECRLSKLKQLFDKGLLTQEEYASKKNEIMRMI